MFLGPGLAELHPREGDSRLETGVRGKSEHFRHKVVKEHRTLNTRGKLEWLICKGCGWSTVKPGEAQGTGPLTLLFDV